jgi:hypothetical protein
MTSYHEGTDADSARDRIAGAEGVHPGAGEECGGKHGRRKATTFASMNTDSGLTFTAR